MFESPKSIIAMKSNSTNELTCSVFGHNLYRSKSKTHSYTELICSTCKAKVVTDKLGNFNEELYTNKEIQFILRELFLLKTKMSRVLFSA